MKGQRHHNEQQCVQQVCSKNERMRFPFLVAVFLLTTLSSTEGCVVSRLAAAGKPKPTYSISTDNSTVICEACKRAVITGCMNVYCKGVDSCSAVTIIAATSVTCEGDACREAEISARSGVTCTDQIIGCGEGCTFKLGEANTYTSQDCDSFVSPDSETLSKCPDQNELVSERLTKLVENGVRQCENKCIENSKTKKYKCRKWCGKKVCKASWVKPCNQIKQNCKKKCTLSAENDNSSCIKSCHWFGLIQMKD